MLSGLGRMAPISGAAPDPGPGPFPPGDVPGYASVFNTTITAAATSYYTGYNPTYAIDPIKAITGNGTTGAWLSAASQVTNQKFNLDLGSAQVVKQLYFENFHGTGSSTTRGIKNFVVYGTNSASAYANTTYADTTDLTELGTFQATQHPATDTADPQYFDLTANATAYRYYVLRIGDNWGDGTYMGCRRIEFQIDSNGYGATAYPAPINTTYVKATSSRGAAYEAVDCAYPVPALTGSDQNACWCSTTTAGQKFNLDLLTAKVGKYLYLENYHNSGSDATIGIKNFVVYGTNSGTAFANTTYADTTDLTELGTFQAAYHQASNEADPQYFDLTANATAYRYYVLRIADNWGDANYIGARRIAVRVA